MSQRDSAAPLRVCVNRRRRRTVRVRRVQRKRRRRKEEAEEEEEEQPPWIQTAECAETLRRLCDNDATLTSLDLSYCRLGDAGATQLAACLSGNTTLTSLHLGVNDIDPRCRRDAAGCVSAYEQHVDEP